jgi:antitoxin MazE
MDQVAIRAWGNSQGIRISKSIMEQLNLEVSDIMDIEVTGNEIILRKAFRHKTFEERMAEYDNRISICDFDWGEPQGGELL